MDDDLQVLVLHDRRVSQQLKRAHGMVAVSVGEDDLLDIRGVEPELEKLDERGVVVARVNNCKIIPCEHVNIRGEMIADQKYTVLKDRMWILENLRKG